MSLVEYTAEPQNTDNTQQPLPPPKTPDNDQSQDPPSSEGNDDQVDPIRYKLLLKVIDKALNKSIECLSVDNLLKCYPSFDSRLGRKYLKNSIDQINGFFLKNSSKDINAILKEKSIKKKMMQLDSIIQDGQKLKQKNDNDDKLHIESLTRNYLIDYNLFLSKTEYMNELKNKLNEYKQDNLKLIQELKDIDDENQRFVGDLEGSVRQMKALKRSLNVDNGDDLDTEFEEYNQYFDQLSRRELFT